MSNTLLKRVIRPYPVTTPANCRAGQQRQMMEEALRTNTCGFCPGGEVFDPAINRQVDLPGIETMYAFHNKWPYKAIAGPHDLDPAGAHHWVVPTRECIAHREHMTPQEWIELYQLTLLTQHQFRIQGLLGYNRSGNPELAATTVSHLHFQLAELMTDMTQDVFFGPFPGDNPFATGTFRISHNDWQYGNVVRKTKYWHVVEAATPYEGIYMSGGRPCHWYFSPKLVRIDTGGITANHWGELRQIQQELYLDYQMPGSFMFWSTMTGQVEVCAMEHGKSVRMTFEN